MLTKKEKERISKFITPDLRPSFFLFKDKNDNPGKYARQEEETCVKTKPRVSMANYLEQFRDGFVKDVLE